MPPHEERMPIIAPRRDYNAAERVLIAQKRAGAAKAAFLARTAKERGK